MGRFPEMMVTQILDVAHVHGPDAVHLAKVPDDGGNVVVRVAAQAAGAQAQNNDNQSAAEYSIFLNAFREGERVV